MNKKKIQKKKIYGRNNGEIVYRVDQRLQQQHMNIIQSKLDQFSENTKTKLYLSLEKINFFLFLIFVKK